MDQVKRADGREDFSSGRERKHRRTGWPASFRGAGGDVTGQTRGGFAHRLPRGAREVKGLAKETMRAVNDAEEAARETLLRAKKEGDRLLEEARERAEKLRADAEKEAAKRANVLVGVAQADGEKLKARSQEESRAQRERLRAQAEAAFPQAAEAVKKIVLGQLDGR